MLLALTGCGSDIDREQFDNGVQLDGTQRYDSIEQLADELTERGIDCSDFERRENSGPGEESADCYLDGEQYILQIFHSGEGRDRQVETRERMQAALDGERCNVLGRGSGAWAVDASDNIDVCQAIAEALGGEARIAGEN